MGFLQCGFSRKAAPRIGRSCIPHGGGFVSGSIYTHRKMIGHLAKAAGSRALLYDYPYAHQQKYPAQLRAALAVYQWLLDQQVAPERLACAGDSSGAILTFGLLQRAREERLALPAAIMIISGWLDMALTGASYETNRDKDTFSTERELTGWSRISWGRRSARSLLQPAVCRSGGLPPIFLQAGADKSGG